MATTHVEEPILSRLDRLDNIVKQLEEIRGRNHYSPKSSCASTPSSETPKSRESSIDFSPKSLEKHCRPIDDVIHETEQKGTLVERLMRVEDRVFKLCLQFEEESGVEKKRGDKISSNEKKPSKKGVKHLLRSCVPQKRSKSNQMLKA